MNNYLLMIITAACWLIPSYLILKSNGPSASKKGLWIVICLFSILLPGIVAVLFDKLVGFVGATLVVKSMLSMQTVALLMFEHNPVLKFAAQASSLAMPFLFYLVFKKRHAQAL